MKQFEKDPRIAWTAKVLAVGGAVVLAVSLAPAVWDVVQWAMGG